MNTFAQMRVTSEVTEGNKNYDIVTADGMEANYSKRSHIPPWDRAMPLLGEIPSWKGLMQSSASPPSCGEAEKKGCLMCSAGIGKEIAIIILVETEV